MDRHRWHVKSPNFPSCVFNLLELIDYVLRNIFLIQIIIHVEIRLLLLLLLSAKPCEFTSVDQVYFTHKHTDVDGKRPAVPHGRADIPHVHVHADTLGEVCRTRDSAADVVPQVK